MAYSEPKPHIETKITFVKTADGGRKTAAFSGYRPQFYYEGRDWDASQHYPDTEKVMPGDTVRALLWFPRPENHTGMLYEGMEFLVREGSRTVGRGIITCVFDKTLIRDSNDPPNEH